MKQISVIVCTFLLLSSVTCYANESRNKVLSTVNSNYYTENMTQTVEEIQNIDRLLSDDDYFEAVFKCLDDYSVYYNSAQTENLTVYNIEEMIICDRKENLEVKIVYFGNGIEKVFSEQVSYAKKYGLKTLILDLSECPGGYVHVMNAIANEIMPKGKIMTAQFKNREQVYYSELEQCPFNEIIVKVSSQTASAAEILAAGLQETGVAKVIGVNTYGKTSIQSFYRLESGAAFKLTCGKYLTGAGRDISQTGVIPDEVDYSYPIKIRWNDYCKEVFGNQKAVSE